jgi:hypothetical protein
MKVSLKGIIWLVASIVLIITGIYLPWEFTLVIGSLLLGAFLGFAFGYYYRRDEEIKDRKDKQTG